MTFVDKTNSKMNLNGLVPARFLTIIAHMVLIIVIFWSRDDNVRSCLPETYSESDYETKDRQLIIGLSFSLGFFLLELIGFMGGLSMFTPVQGLLSTAVHFGATIALIFFLFERWSCDDFWYIFAFCSGLPAITEIATMVVVGVMKKSI